jgi:sensor histidine kinase regulating citrate/malate metabolism
MDYFILPLTMIDDMDICIVLGNALNNAIEACQRVENPMNKKIELKMRYKRKTLTVEMKNPYDINTVNLKNGKYVSSKKFRKDYEIGIGMESIKAVAKKYNGLCETDMQSEIFVLKVIMPNEKLI